jgi:Baseplate J-like protein
MSNGRLVPPNLDDRTWQDIVNEAKALIPKYTPEWTDHNLSDLGITLIELFAWIAEQIIYRLNRVPDKNYIKFLDLIGVRRYPPTPARADITFRIDGDKAVTIPMATQISTKAAGKEDGVIFETEEELNAVNIKKCIFIDGTNNYKDYTANWLNEHFVSQHLKIPFTTKGILLLGLSAPVTCKVSITFRIESGIALAKPGYVYSAKKDQDPPNWPTITQITNPAFAFAASDKVGMQVPADWVACRPADWPTKVTPGSPSDEVTDPFYWIGIIMKSPFQRDMELVVKRIAANVVSAINVVTVEDEKPWRSNGKPFQVFQPRNAPLYLAPDPGNQTQLGQLLLQVKDAGGVWADWKLVETFTQNAPEYMCDPITGEIMFGNYAQDKPDKPGYGLIPPEGSEIKVLRYCYVAGGSNGNVPPNAIVVQRKPVPGVVSVTNEIEATGGSDWENLEDTKRRGPQSLKVCDRAVTAEDYEYLALAERNTAVAKVRCLPPNPGAAGPLQRIAPLVNIVLVPNIPNNNDDDTTREITRRPMPSDDLIEIIRDFLNNRRTITAQLVFPQYNNPSAVNYFVEVGVNTTVHVKEGQDTISIKQEIRQKLYDFLHPVSGGLDGHGWQIGEDLTISKVFSVLESVPEINYISTLNIYRIDGNYKCTPPFRVQVDDHEIICAPKFTDTTNLAVTVQTESSPAKEMVKKKEPSQRARKIKETKKKRMI